MDNRCLTPLVLLSPPSVLAPLEKGVDLAGARWGLLVGLDDILGGWRGSIIQLSNGPDAMVIIIYRRRRCTVAASLLLVDSC
jgi:hypothetical protein